MVYIQDACLVASVTATRCGLRDLVNIKKNPKIQNKFGYN